MKRKINWKKVFEPTDSVAIVVVVIGLLIAIFLDELAIRLIGVCVALLGGIALVMKMSTRMGEIFDDRYKPSQPPPNYKITVKKETGAKRHTFEDFERLTVEGDPEIISDDLAKSSSPEEDIKKIQKTFEKPKQTEFQTVQGEGFKIIDNKSTSSIEEKREEQIKTDTKDTFSVSFNEDFDFDDGVSSVRFVSKKQSDKPTATTNFKEKTDEPSEAGTEQKDESPAPKQIIIDAGYEEDSLFQGVQSKTEEIKLEPTTEQAKPEEKEVFEKPEPVIEETQKQKLNFQKKNIDISISSILETETFAEQEPRKEFEYFLNRVLKIIRSITNTRTAAFLLVNLEKRELILQAYDSETPESITPKMKLPIRDDIVSQIAVNIKPEILTEINPAVELDLLPYYTRKVGTGSFVGVPVFYKKAVIGILCADSSAPDAYEAFTVGFLGHFTKLIGSLVSTYTEKYELQQASKTLTAINEFRRIMTDKTISLDSIYLSILDASCKIFDYTTIGICGYNQENDSWKITGILSKNEIDSSLAGHEIKLKSTYVGDSIDKSKTIFISPMLDVGMMYHPKETKYPGGFFTSVPLKSSTNSYGALFVVGKSQSNVTSYDLKILETIGDNAGAMLEHFLFKTMLKNNSMVETSGILNEAAFINRLEEEINKSKDFGNKLALCLFTVDKLGVIDPEIHPDRAERVSKHVTEIFRKYLKSYYPMGKIRENIYGIVITEMNGPDSHRWAEKIRSEIARTPIEIDNKRYYITVSIGISEKGKGETIVSLADNAMVALNLSEDKSNKVTLYE